MKILKCFWVFTGMISLSLMTSCDKIKDLTDDAKSLVGGDDEKSEKGNQDATVTSVGKKDGEQIIASETSRIVMVEYYSDT